MFAFRGGGLFNFLAKHGRVSGLLAVLVDSGQRFFGCQMWKSSVELCRHLLPRNEHVSRESRPGGLRACFFSLAPPKRGALRRRAAAERSEPVNADARFSLVPKKQLAKKDTKVYSWPRSTP